MTVELAIFLVDGSDEEKIIDGSGLQALQLFKGIGVTSFVAAIQNCPPSHPKHAAAVKKRALKQLSAEMGDGVKVFPLSTEADCRSLLLHVQPDKITLPHWRRQRPSLFIQSCQRLETDAVNGTCSLALEGHVRHAALSANQAVAVSGFGDYAIEKILHHSRERSSAEMVDAEAGLLPDRALQESLVRENEAVPEDEMLLDEEGFEDAMQKTTRHVPKGTSEYQAAWIPDTESITETDTETLSQDMCPEDLTEKPEEDIDALRETQSIGDAMTGLGDSDTSWQDEEVDTAARIEEEEGEKRFPNEVYAPHDEPARVRFQHYRGLKSFRTSPWDAKTDLPESYSRIFAFDRFAHAMKSAKKEILQETQHMVPMHSRITLVLKEVPTDVAGEMEKRVAAFLSGDGGPLFTVGLMRHEVKMSVLHYRVMKAKDYSLPVANKERFLFVSGFRRFQAAPLFSTDNPGYDKHQMERFLQEGNHTIASIYGQIMFPPMPLLAFKLSSDASLRPQLAFHGTLQSCAPERVILKQIILTGRVSKAVKKRAVVKGMFHTPEDVRWFKPLELWTKCGRTGYIKESLGTKGHMKCYFDGNIQHHDTICISLYKRVFPVWPND